MKTRGYILLTALVISSILIGITAGVLFYLTSYERNERYAVASAKALAIAEAGIDNAMYQLDQNSGYTGESNTALGAGAFTTVVTSVGNNTVRVTVTGSVPASNPTATRKITLEANVNTNVVSFHYGVQVGEGGITMGNGSVINGSVYSDGPISGGGTVTVDATAAGSSSISGITIDGNATAHSLLTCTIGKNANYYQTNTCTTGGTSHPNYPDQPVVPFPITDQQISDWEDQAQQGGSLAGPYNLSGSQTLGPVKITGDLNISNNAHLILGGPVWVYGNVTFGNNSYFQVAASTGNSGAILIADQPGNRNTKGIITLSNNMTISGNGNVGSYPMAISGNTGGSAISLANNANSVILFAPYGTIAVSNGASASEIVGYQISMANVSTLNYVSGLQSQSFSDGPGGSWVVIPGTYAIIK